MPDPLFILLIALVLDWYLGEPEVLWSRFTHPIVLFGQAVAYVDKKLNHAKDSSDNQYKKGAVGISILLLIALVCAFLLEGFIRFLGFFGFFLELFIVFVLLAQKSLLLFIR